MVETIIKRKIIKKKKKPKKSKAKPTQKQTQTQIVNIYNSGKLRNPIGIKRQKQKNIISPLETRRVYRPISINQHVNSFEVEQRLYRKIADENRLNQMAQKQEKENQLRVMQQKEIEKTRVQQQVQLDLTNRLKNLESKLNESQRTQLDQPEYNSFDDTPSMGFGDKNLDEEPVIKEEDPELTFKEGLGPDILSDEEISQRVSKNSYETLISSKLIKLKEYAERYNEDRAEPFEFATNKKELVNQLFLKGIDIGTGPIKYVTFGEERSEADLRRV